MYMYVIMIDGFTEISTTTSIYMYMGDVTRCVITIIQPSTEPRPAALNYATYTNYVYMTVQCTRTRLDDEHVHVHVLVQS